MNALQLFRVGRRVATGEWNTSQILRLFRDQKLSKCLFEG
jgi:hypothetical protein